jgi:DNA excision repair protein ERCC-4
MEKPTIIIDERERNSKVPELLVKKGVSIKFRVIEVGDYIVSQRIGIERKTIRDFIKSIYDGRIFDQITRLKEKFEIPVIIVEGDLNELILFVDNPNVFRGALITLILFHNAKIFFSINEEETADYISLMAKKEIKEKKEFFLPFLKTKPKTKDIKHIQLNIIKSFPYIGTKSAFKILKEYKTIKNFVNTNEAQLSKVIGLAKARKILEILNKNFEKEESLIS